MKHLYSSGLVQKVCLVAIFAMFFAVSSSAQTATIHNNLSFDVDLKLFGVNSSCTQTSSNHTATVGVSSVSGISGVEYWVGASVIGTSCNSSTTVQDYSDSPCTGTTVSQSTFTSYQGCYYAVDKTIVIDIVVAGTDYDIEIYEL